MSVAANNAEEGPVAHSAELPPDGDVESVSDTPAGTTRTWLVRVGQLAVLVVVLGSWQLVSTKHWVNPTFSSRPTDVWHALVSFYQSGELLRATAATSEAVALSFLIGTITGTLFGFTLGLMPYLDRILGPYLVPLNSVPRIALAPLFILWFGLSITSKIALAVSIVFFILAINARASVKSIEPDFLLLARVLGFGRARILATVVFPSAIPAVFAGVRLAVTYSLLGVVTSEIISAQSGLGVDIVAFSNQLDVAGVMAILLELAFLATLVTILLDVVERFLLRWQRA
jgi:NitT/TauT family transport system permease protein